MKSIDINPDVYVKGDANSTKFCLCVPFTKGMPALAGFTILCLVLSLVDAIMGDTGMFSLLFIAPQIPASILMGMYLKENTAETRSKLSTAFCLNSFAAAIALVVHAVSFIKHHKDVFDADDSTDLDEQIRHM